MRLLTVCERLSMDFLPQDSPVISEISPIQLSSHSLFSLSPVKEREKILIKWNDFDYVQKVESILTLASICCVVLLHLILIKDFCKVGTAIIKNNSLELFDKWQSRQRVKQNFIFTWRESCTQRKRKLP